MGKYNEELVKAGVMLAGDGLHPSSKGARVALLRQRAHRDRRPVRRDQGAHRRLLGVAGEVARRGDRVGQALSQTRSTAARPRSRSARSSRPTTSARSSRRSCASRRRACASRSRRTGSRRRGADDRACRRATSTARHRSGLADRVGPADRRPRAHRARRRPRRGARAGRARRRARAVARVGRPGQPGRVADGHGEAPRASTSFRRAAMLERKHEDARPRAQRSASRPIAEIEAAIDDNVGDDLLRLVFIACHPVLSTEARVALTLRLLGGLTTDEIARAFLVPEPTIAQRIVRAKRTLAEAQRAVRGAARRTSSRARLASVLEVDLPDLQRGLRGDAPATTGCARSCARRRCGSAASSPELVPDEPEVHGLVALMEIQASRAARAHRPVRGAGPAARPGPRALGPAAHPARPRGAGARRGARRRRSARTRCRPRSPPATRAPGPADETDWERIVALYDALAAAHAARRSSSSTARSPSSMAFGPAAGLELVDALADEPALRRLPPAAERARRPARQARPRRRGARGVRARRVAHAQRARARSCCSSVPACSPRNGDLPP